MDKQLIPDCSTLLRQNRLIMLQIQKFFLVAKQALMPGHQRIGAPNFYVVEKCLHLCIFPRIAAGYGIEIYLKLCDSILADRGKYVSRFRKLDCRIGSKP